jgi:receptor-interacting serine/threonine-protein kinase 5
MARDMLVTPRKLEYAREKEQVLFDSLTSLASMKQEELKYLINKTIDTHREAILNAARQYQFIDIELIDDNENENNSTNVSEDARRNSITVKFVKDFKRCTQQIQELVITKLNNAIAQEISDSVEVLKENYIGTLKRCLQSLEDMNGSVVASENLQNGIIVMCRLLLIQSRDRVQMMH